MKSEQQSKSAKRNRYGWVLMLVTMMVPVSGYSQPAPPPGSGGSGTSPDTPLSVPFSADMNILFALIGVVFAAVILFRLQKKRTVVA